MVNNTYVPSSHNILLYEDGHAVVADFGGKAKTPITVFYTLNEYQHLYVSVPFERRTHCKRKDLFLNQK